MGEINYATQYFILTKYIKIAVIYPNMKTITIELRFFY